MPVIGHAFVGLATAAITRPADPTTRRAVLWAPAIVGAAYLPDVLWQIARIAGLNSWHPATHSLVMAVPLSLLFGGVLAHLAHTPFRLTSCVVFVSLGLHDVLDLLHATGRAPLWPLVRGPIDIGWAGLTLDVWSESFVYGVPAAVVTGTYFILRRRHGRQASYACSAQRPALGLTLIAWCPIGCILLAALGTQHLRDVREDELERAQECLIRRQYGEALYQAAQADRWPSVARPGRTDYLRAQAYEGMGNRILAEQFYLRSTDADPTYFWAVADLAHLYASSGEPLEARRRCAAPYISRLQRDFAGHRDCPRYLAKLAAKLIPPAEPVRLSAQHGPRTP
jgi:hypothetical protein